MTKQNQYAVVMPKLGLIMSEALLSEWYKEAGAWVEVGEVLFALESEKATIEIEAPASGVLHILVAAGETVPVMTEVAYLVGGQGAVSVNPDVRSDKAEVRATPKVRGLAQQRGIDLAGKRGSGMRGMVVSADLAPIVQPTQPATVNATPVAQKFSADLGLDLTTITGTGNNNRITRQDVVQTAANLLAQGNSAPVAAPLPLSGLRGIIAQRLSTGWRERPQVTLSTEIDATNLVSAREQLGQERGEKIAYNAFFVLAVARALQEQPQVNVRLTAAGIEQLPEIHIGIAVDTQRGLLVPVVRHAGQKSLATLDGELGELTQRALAGSSLPDELRGGTFTITNLGMFGIDMFTPIINPPEAAILGVGRIQKRPIVVGSQVEIRDRVTLSLSFDHRLLDGAPAGQFLQRVGQLLERPFVLVGN